jgi:hypothetical protein
MRIYATYDEAGNIVALAIPADDVKEGELGLVAEPGQYVSEIEVDDTADTQRHELLNDLARNYRVERSATRTRFIKKSNPGRKTSE